MDAKKRMDEPTTPKPIPASVLRAFHVYLAARDETAARLKARMGYLCNHEHGADVSTREPAYHDLSIEESRAEEAERYALSDLDAVRGDLSLADIGRYGLALQETVRDAVRSYDASYPDYWPTWIDDLRALLPADDEGKAT